MHVLAGIALVDQAIDFFLFIMVSNYRNHHEYQHWCFKILHPIGRFAGSEQGLEPLSRYSHLQLFSLSYDCMHCR
jgi:hypothetical protein